MDIKNVQTHSCAVRGDLPDENNAKCAGASSSSLARTVVPSEPSQIDTIFPKGDLQISSHMLNPQYMLVNMG